MCLFLAGNSNGGLGVLLISRSDSARVEAFGRGPAKGIRKTVHRL